MRRPDRAILCRQLPYTCWPILRLMLSRPSYSGPAFACLRLIDMLSKASSAPGVTPRLGAESVQPSGRFVKEEFKFRMSRRTGIDHAILCTAWPDASHGFIEGGESLLQQPSPMPSSATLKGTSRCSRALRRPSHSLRRHDLKR